MKSFGPGFHVYQYLFKTNRPEIPFEQYKDPVVADSCRPASRVLRAKRDHLYRSRSSIAFSSKVPGRRPGVGADLRRLVSDPSGRGLRTEGAILQWGHEDAPASADRAATWRGSSSGYRHSSISSATSYRSSYLNQTVNSVSSVVCSTIDDWRNCGPPKSTQFLDYQVANSDIEAERDYLRVGDHFVRVLTMKEAIGRLGRWRWTLC